MHQPRSLFRSRKRPAAYVAPLLTAVAKHRDRFRPGTVTELRTWHRHDCPWPQGGDCICRPGEIEVEIVDPERN